MLNFFVTEPNHRGSPVAEIIDNINVGFPEISPGRHDRTVTADQGKTDAGLLIYRVFTGELIFTKGDGECP